MSMTFKHVVLAAAAVVSSAGAYAVDAAAAKALATKSACLSCHAADKKIVGPAYKDVAAKHKGEADAVAKVAARIKSGGSGLYGAVPMPPQAALKDDELKLLAEWVLAGAPDK
jgi:cytochrome c